MSLALTLSPCPFCKGEMGMRKLSTSHTAQEWLLECQVCSFVKTYVGTKLDAKEKFNKEFPK